MNDVYFFCEACKTYIEAGYRHAVHSLERCGLLPEDLLGREVTHASVSAADVLACVAYWDTTGLPEANAEQVWRARSFIDAHVAHPLSFGDIHRVLGRGLPWWEWMNEDGQTDLTPRFLVERLGLAGWEDVESYVAAARRRPWWWSIPSARVEARRRFEESARDGQ
jgi:hypothetical protein